MALGLFWVAAWRLVVPLFDNWGLLVTGVLEATVEVERGGAADAADAEASIGATGASVVSSCWSPEGIDGKEALAEAGEGDGLAAAGVCVGLESCGCISTKPKQNTEITTNGIPINSRCEPLVGLELLIL
jgi:hypothetical protein